MTGNHYKAAEISDRVANLSKQWEMLNANCVDKGHKLNEANELQLFLRAVEEVAMWMSLAEALLASEDLGKDLQSAKFLLKKHQVRIYVRMYICMYIRVCTYVPWLNSNLSFHNMKAYDYHSIIFIGRKFYVHIYLRTYDVHVRI